MYLNRKLAFKEMSIKHDFVIANADTDSISFKRSDSKPFTKEDRQALLTEINSMMPPWIAFDDDDYYKRFIVLGGKNYIMQKEDGEVKLKGSAIKATNKEPALREFILEVIDLLLTDRKEHTVFVYMKYVKEIFDIKDMARWVSKKTITKAVMENERTNEKIVRDALKGKPVSEGDKIYVFYKTDDEMELLERFDGTYERNRLLEKLYDTLCIFDAVFDVSMFPNFKLSRNKELLNELI